MKNISKMVLFVLLTTFVSIQVKAQESILEKNYEISRKSKKGYLGRVIELEDGKFDMVYILKSMSKRKIKSEIYHFDKEANLLGIERDEIELDKARKKWKWFTFKGDYFITNAVSASGNLLGDLVFKKKQIKANYNWWTGQYDRSVKMLDKVKPRGDGGKKLKFLGGAYEIERDSTILVMSYDGDQPKEKLGTSFKLIKADNNLNLTFLEDINFSHAVTCVFSKPLIDNESDVVLNDDAPRDWILVYAPSNMFGKSARAEDPSLFEYIRISPEGKVKERFQFKTPATGFRILDAYENNGSVLLYGMGSGKDDKFATQIFNTQMVPTTSNSAEEQEATNSSSSGSKLLGGFKDKFNAIAGSNDTGVTQEAIDASLDLLKYNSFVLVKVKNQKLLYAKTTEIDEVNDKATCPPDMKKPLKFDGNKFQVSNVNYLNDNSLVLSFQDFKTTSKGNIYKGMFMLHFAESGDLIKNYTINLEQKGKKGFFNNSPLTSDMVPARSYVYQTANPNKLNWILHIVKDVDVDTDYDTNYSLNGSSTTTKTTTYTPLYTIQYGTIDLAKKEASDFKLLGEDEKKKFYLYPKNNSLNINKYLYFFSETLRGDKMLISRMTLE